MRLPLRTTPVTAFLPDAHVQNARAYALPRVYEASRRRSLVPDPLLLSMLPPSAPEVAHTSALCQQVLSVQLATIQEGSYRPAPGHQQEPTLQTPLALTGVVADKYVDDELLVLVHSMRKHLLHTGGVCQRMQIVDLGCGLGTRPWRLPLSSNVAWFDVDLPAVLEEKGRLLAAAGAETTPPPANADILQGHSEGRSAAAGGRGDGIAASAGAARFPLLAGSYAPVVCHMLKGNLPEALEAHGWDPQAPTIWLAFALVYYLDGRAVNLLMKTVAAASAAAPCSAFVGTVMNAGMVDMIQQAVAAAAAGVQAEVNEPLPSATQAEATATVDPETSCSMDASDEIRRSGGMQAAATAMKFGVKRDVTTFLRGYGWETVEELPLPALEQLYGVLGVAMEYPAELRQRVQAKHGHQPLCSVGVGRRGF